MAKQTDPANPVVLAVVAAKREAEQAKANRMAQNKENIDCYHLRQNWDHKQKGQSKEFLAKQNIAVEQLTSFLQQGLIDRGDWFAIENAPGVRNEQRVIMPDDMFKILKHQLEQTDFYTFAGDSIKTGSLQSLMIAKVHGKKICQVKYRTELRREGFWGKTKKALMKDEKYVWRLQIDLVRPEDFYPDPTGRKLYNIQDIEIDLWELKKIAKENPDDYDMGMIDRLQGHIDEEQRANRSRETGQNNTTQRRKMITVTEYWGTLVDSDSGEVLGENVVAAIANDRWLIRPMQPNPLWHGEDPFVTAPIRRVPSSVWHQALMDAPTKHNHALNEVYNLMLDSGLQSVFGIRQIREDWLADQSQISDGIPAGATLRASATCPPGQKVLERVDTASEFSQATSIFQLTDREFMASAFSNDTRMGQISDRQVKATELVSTNQVLTGISNGMVKSIEAAYMSAILEKAWMTSAQHLDDFSSDEMKALLGEEKAMAIGALAPEDRFAQTAQGRQFKVFGLSMTLNKINDFKKFQALLQTLAASPLLLAEFMKRYDMGKFLGEIVKSLDINTDKIAQASSGAMEDGQADRAASPEAAQQIMAQIAALSPNTGGGQGGPGGPMSQVPQADSTRRLAENGANAPRRQMLSGGVTTPGS